MTIHNREREGEKEGEGEEEEEEEEVGQKQEGIRTQKRRPLESDEPTSR